MLFIEQDGLELDLDAGTGTVRVVYGARSALPDEGADMARVFPESFKDDEWVLTNRQISEGVFNTASLKIVKKDSGGIDWPEEGEFRESYGSYELQPDTYQHTGEKVLDDGTTVGLEAYADAPDDVATENPDGSKILKDPCTMYTFLNTFADWDKLMDWSDHAWALNNVPPTLGATETWIVEFEGKREFKSWKNQKNPKLPAGIRKPAGDLLCVDVQVSRSSQQARREKWHVIATFWICPAGFGWK